MRSEPRHFRKNCVCVCVGGASAAELIGVEGELSRCDNISGAVLATV